LKDANLEAENIKKDKNSSKRKIYRTKVRARASNPSRDKKSC
jgi:hypothetical protein